MVEFRICFSNFITSITKQSKIGFVVEVIIIRTHSCKTNKLRNIYTIGRGARNISIKKSFLKWKMNCSGVNVDRYIVIRVFS